MLDRKGILAFLGVTFAITYGVEIPLVLVGYRFDASAQPVAQIAVVVLMWAPALAAFLTMRFVTHEQREVLNLRLGTLKPYLATAGLLPLLFIVVYGLSWLLGLGQPDWGLVAFQNLIAAAPGSHPISAMPSPWMIWPALYLAALITGPFISTLFALGEEIGWRGYLLPKLMPLGKPRAYLLLGLIWSAWHWPIILAGFNYGLSNPFLGILAFTLVTTGLGIYLSELALRYRSCVLAGWGHGVFNSQRASIWGLLFNSVNPFLGGWTGIIGAVTWLALGLWQLRPRGRTAAHL